MNETKALNRALAAKIREFDGVPNGATWKVAKDALAKGAHIETAALCGVLGHGYVPVAQHVEEAPIAQVETPKKRRSPKVMPVQAQRVQAGNVERDAKGRILSKEEAIRVREARVAARRQELARKEGRGTYAPSQELLDALREVQGTLV